MPERTFSIASVRIPGRALIAPMTGVSDLPFRRAASRCGAAYVATEMVACDAFARGRPDVVRRAAVGDGLPLMVIQLVGRDAEWIARGAALAGRAGADIVDINMGCPAKEVAGAQSGAALMRDLDHAEALIAAAANAASCAVTVKMRLGWDSVVAPELAMRAERAGAQAVTVHGRTRQQFYSGVADWRAVAAVKQAVSIPVIVNGDVTDAASAREALAQSVADAVMIGRGAYGRPWIASQLDGKRNEPDLDARLAIALDHFADTLRFYGDALGLRVFRKHLGWYIEHAPWGSAQERRAAKSALCRLTTARDVEWTLTSLWHGEWRLAA